MAEKNEDPKTNWVSDIFQPGKKQARSALFGRQEPSPIPGLKAEPKTQAIQRRYPIGLDIGSSSIKMVQLGLASDGALEVINMALEKLPAPNNAADTLKRIFSERRINGDVVSSISSAKAQIRRFDLPKMPEPEIEGALKWEIRQTTSEDVDGLSLNYILLPDEPEKAAADKLRLLVVTVPKKDVFEHLAVVQATGLLPKAVEVDPLAGYTSLTYNEQFSAQDAVIFLDFGLEAASLNVIANGVRFSRNLFTTGRYLTKYIADTFSVDLSKAEEMKLKMGLSGDVRDCLISALEKLVLEIDHSFKYFSYSLTGSKVVRFDKVFLSGGTSNLKGLASFLEEKLAVPVLRVNPFKRTRISDAARRSAGDLDEMSPYFCVAFGLALREI